VWNATTAMWSMRFEKDDEKPKVTERKMIGMMMAINKDNFEGHREVKVKD
jgi:hypothetical protein